MSRQTSCRQPHHLKNSDLHCSINEKAWPTISRCRTSIEVFGSSAHSFEFNQCTHIQEVYVYIYIYENFIICKPDNQQSSIVDNGMHIRSKQNNRSAKVGNYSRVFSPACAQVLYWCTCDGHQHSKWNTAVLQVPSVDAFFCPSFVCRGTYCDCDGVGHVVLASTNFSNTRVCFKDCSSSGTSIQR